MTYAMSTDMQEEEIIFGGEKKLRKAVEEAIELFHPKAVGIFSTCPVGLIGDDVHSVCRDMEEKYPDINIFGFSCEGYKGVSQSAGHHIANNKVFADVVGQIETPKEGEFRLNILGEYNIGGDAFEIERIVEACGLTLHATFSGNSELRGVRQRPYGGPQCGHVPPVDQLHGRHDGKEIRHTLVQDQLYRGGGHR